MNNSLAVGLNLFYGEIMGKKQNGVRTIVDNPLKSQKIKENPLALAIWICYNY